MLILEQNISIPASPILLPELQLGGGSPECLTSALTPANQRQGSSSVRLEEEVSHVISLLAGKWTCNLLCILCEGSIRLSQLQRRIPGVSRKVLVAELRRLEDRGLLHRLDLSTRYMKHVEYALAGDLQHRIGHLMKTLASWRGLLERTSPGVACQQAAGEFSKGAF